MTDRKEEIEELIEKSREVRERAYAPYSKFRVATVEKS